VATPQTQPIECVIPLPQTGNAPTLPCDPGTKVTWRNDTGHEVDLHLPHCVSNGGTTVHLLVGGSTQRETVNGRKGTYPYIFDVSLIQEEIRIMDTRSGTIDVLS
jgi:hypothetical protein